MVLSLFSLAPEALSGAQERGRNALWIELCDTTGLDASILRAARGETSEIFSTAEAHLRWEGNCAAVPRTIPNSARIYVVQRLAKGVADWYEEHGGRRNVMGYVGFVDVHDGVEAIGEGNRAAVIYVGRQTVEAVASKSGRISLTEALMARAMGRVFAHELAHRFLGPGHTKHGILKARLYQKDLIDWRNSGFFFSPEQIRLLRLRIANGYATQP
jgi:hypothetical protein